jgi:limonene-1,2-epoxide hydrolase
MSADNEAVVTEFLLAMESEDVARQRELLSDDVEWRNTGLPTVRGRRVGAMVASMGKYRIGFAVDFRAVTSTGDTVRTDRTDHLSWGPLRMSIDIDGHFTVRDGRITVWDDRFGWLQALLSTRVGRRLAAAA